MIFSERLHELRCKRKMTQKALAKALNYTSSTIANYESGRNEPCIRDIIKLADFLTVTIDYMLGVSDVPIRSHFDCNNQYLVHLISLYNEADPLKTELLDYQISCSLQLIKMIDKSIN